MSQVEKKTCHYWQFSKQFSKLCLWFPSVFVCPRKKNWWPQFIEFRTSESCMWCLECVITCSNSNDPKKEAFGLWHIQKEKETGLECLVCVCIVCLNTNMHSMCVIRVTIAIIYTHNYRFLVNERDLLITILPCVLVHVFMWEEEKVKEAGTKREREWDSGGNLVQLAGWL